MASWNIGHKSHSLTWSTKAWKNSRRCVFIFKKILNSKHLTMLNNYKGAVCMKVYVFYWFLPRLFTQSLTFVFIYYEHMNMTTNCAVKGKKGHGSWKSNVDLRMNQACCCPLSLFRLHWSALPPIIGPDRERDTLRQRMTQGWKIQESEWTVGTDSQRKMSGRREKYQQTKSRMNQHDRTPKKGHHLFMMCFRCVHRLCKD